MQNMKPLILANSLHGFEIHATDGVVGRIDDFYFNDQTWKISNVVADLGRWLTGRKVVVAPDIFGHADWRKKFIEALATREKISESPDSDTVMPVALQIEKRINLSILQDTMVPEGFWGMHQYIEPQIPGKADTSDPHLRSTRILRDCTIVSEDNKGLGRILDFLVDTEAWEIRFLLLKTDDSRIFLAGPGIVESIDVGNRSIKIVHPEDQKNDWQEYDPHYMALLEIGERR